MRHKTTFNIGQQVWFMRQNKIHTGTVFKILILKDENDPDGSEQVWVGYTLGNEKFEEFFVDCLFKSKAKLVKYLTATAQ